MKKLVLVAFLAAVVSVVFTACGGGKGDDFSDRGRYIYDDAKVLPIESEISLASYLWRLDSQTSYEIVLVFPKEMMDEQAIIDWFNAHGVGKKDRDTGAAIFIFPDKSVFVAIGSGNDKVSVTFSKTQGERIFKDFSDDPILTLLRFTSALGGQIDKASSIEIGGSLFASVKDNLNLILLWVAFVAFFFFFIQQLDGFQPRDLILPLAVFAVLGIFFGFSALGSSSSFDTYKTYGIITSTKTGSYEWVHMHEHCITTGSGKTQTTTCYSTPHMHTMYTNDVTFSSYESKTYTYRFETDEYKGAWERGIGELDSLAVHVQSGELQGVSGLDDNSGGETIGDGVWIEAAKKGK